MRRLVLMKRPSTLALVIAACLAVLPPGPASAWDSLGAPLCTLASSQINSAVIGVADGGMISVWEDHRGADTDLYLQRLNQDGQVHFAFPAGGLPLSAAPGNQTDVSVLKTVSGFAAIWMDTRSGSLDLYAVRCGFDGMPLPGWSANGVPVCTAAGDQGSATLVERNGELFAFWIDARNTLYYVYASQITMGPTLPKPGGEFSGIPIIAGFGRGVAADAVDASAAYVVVTNSYGVRVMRAIGGSPDPVWPSAGIGISPSTLASEMRIASHPDGGAVVAWIESGVVRVQRVLPSGAIANGWPAAGVALVPEPGVDAWDLQVICDPAGNVLVTEIVGENSFSSKLWIAKLGLTGESAPGWPLVLREPAQLNFRLGQMIMPCSGTVAVIWSEGSGAGFSNVVRVQQVSDQGQVLWAPGGVPITQSPGRQLVPAIATTGTACGTMVVSWSDDRYAHDEFDVFGAKVLFDGSVVAVSDAVVPRAPFSVRVIGENPSRGRARLAVNGIEPGRRVTVEIVDVMGRQVRSLSDGQPESGTIRIDWDGRGNDGAAAASGVYLARVRSGNDAAIARVVIAR